MRQSEGGDAAAPLTVALGYLARGWAVVPVQYRTKRPYNPDRPNGTEWQHLRATEAELRRWFGNGDHNIGVLLGLASGGLVDVDLDTPEAVALAEAFLPRTDAIFGRPGNPRSHWLYRTGELASEQFKDPETGAMLVEIRSRGAQTVFPPSVHPDGEVVAWDQGGDPVQIDEQALRSAVGLLAAAALLARHWPGEGGRHDAQLTLTAILIRAGWSAERVAGFVAQVSSAAGGVADMRKRRATAADTIQRLANGQPVRGFPALIDLFGAKIAHAAFRWLGMSFRSSIEEPAEPGASAHELRLGSHVELARRLVERLGPGAEHLKYAERQFWRWSGTQWQPLSDAQMRREVHALDGEPIADRRRPVTLTKSHIDGVLNELGYLLAEEGFFTTSPAGVACRSGFLTLSREGAVLLAPHAPEQRRRVILDAEWNPGLPDTPPPGSLLHQLLAAAPEIAPLLAEVIGAVAFNLAPHLATRRAIVLFGPTLTGKSVFIALARAVVAPDAVAAVDPCRFGDDRHLIQLRGKALNAVDELGGAGIEPALFKQVVSGEPVTARDVYESAVRFEPQALQIYACNAATPFRTGFDGAARRRLLVVPFTSSVPERERIPDLSARIVREEGALLLAWLVGGAARLLQRRDFQETAACAAALREWGRGADPISAWLNDPEAVVWEEGARVRTKLAFAGFRSWGEREGYQGLPPHGAFTQRALSLSEGRLRYARASDGSYFDGIRILHHRGAQGADR